MTQSVRSGRTAKSYNVHGTSHAFNFALWPDGIERNSSLHARDAADVSATHSRHWESNATSELRAIAVESKK